MNDEYIKRSAVQCAVNDARTELKKGCDISQFEYLLIRLSKIQPANVVPVVRCKYCLNWKRDAYGGVCDRYGVRLDRNWFCAGGEKREVQDDN